MVVLLSGENLLKGEAKSNQEKETLEHDNYGDATLNELRSSAEAGKWSKAVDGKVATSVGDVVKEMAGSEIRITGYLQTSRAVSKKRLFLIIREGGYTVQCVATQSVEAEVSDHMIGYLKQLSRESIVDVIGVVSIPLVPLHGTTQQVEIQLGKLYCISRPEVKYLPFSVEDASRSDVEIKESRQAGKEVVAVNQDTRLNNRVLDLRTPANQAIFSLKYQAEHAFREFLTSKKFVGIHTPKLMAGSPEGGGAVFELPYIGNKPASLAQSGLLHKQMTICGGFKGVFEVGPCFRAENSSTRRHLCEFIGLGVEMQISKHYSEIMDLADGLFVFIFTHLNEKCKENLEAIRTQYPFKPLKFLSKTLRLPFEEGIQMLKEAGVEIDPLGDLNTESERKLGELVLKKYNTDFYILHGYPLQARPFATMPCANDSSYSNSFDAFVRGQEILSGAQRIHTSELLEKRAKECEVDVSTISSYIDSFRYGTYPHGGFTAGLERVIMQFCGLDNIHKISLFPRDPVRLTP